MRPWTNIYNQNTLTHLSYKTLDKYLQPKHIDQPLLQDPGQISTTKTDTERDRDKEYLDNYSRFC